MSDKDKLSDDEVSNRVLAILQSSDFTKTLESFSGEKLKPTMNIMAKKINKAKKGELKCPLPVGFYYDEKNRIRLDSDEQVRSSLQLLFKVFKETGSAYGVAHYFGKNNIRFPKRAYFSFASAPMTTSGQPSLS